MGTVKTNQSTSKTAAFVGSGKFALLVCAAGLAASSMVVVPAVLARDLPVSHASVIESTTVASATTDSAHRGTTAASKPVSDTSPSCPEAFMCLQSGPDPLVPFGTDPSVPYGTWTWNSAVPYGRGSSSYTGGAV
jgi:hypothetical protein